MAAPTRTTWVIKGRCDVAGGRLALGAAAADEPDRARQFERSMAVGDAVLVPTGKEVVVGIVDGDLDADRRRPVRWVGRHGREELPNAWRDLAKQRHCLQRYDALALTEHVDAVAAGAIGRPARSAPAPRARAATAGAARPVPAAKQLRTCPGCSYQLAPSMFDDGEDLCRDCR